MKTSLRFFLLLAVVTSLILTACEPTDGDTTSDDPRDQFVGKWQFIESFKSTEGQSYVVNITKDITNSSQVNLENFGNPGSNDVSATGIVTSNQIVISSQRMSNNWTVDGTGKMANLVKTAMTWNYSITAGGDKLSYTASATKQ